MVHPLASQCGFYFCFFLFFISDPAITIGAIPPHIVNCIVIVIVLYCIGDGPA